MFFVQKQGKSSKIITFPLNSENYPRDLGKLYGKVLSHIKNTTYLDYTGAGVYSDIVIQNYLQELAVTNPNKSLEILQDVKNEVLSFVGASSNDYSVVFVASATQALKVVGETFPFNSNNKFVYTTYNHNSVLGIRRYALANNASFETISSPLQINDLKSIPTNPNTYNLFAFPVEDNYAGTKVKNSDLKAITNDPVIKSKWFLLADTAAFLPTNPLNLTETPLDAIIMSFYKIIGFPNTGALVIRKDAISKLKKRSYLSKSAEIKENPIPLLIESDLSYVPTIAGIEDDKPPASLNLAVIHGLRALKQIGMKNIQNHVWNLTRKLFLEIDSMKHSTGIKAAEIYGNHNMNDYDSQGGIVAFNMKTTNGSYIGYSMVVKEGSTAGYHLRGGCQCNPGACFTTMRISEAKVKSYFSAKETCGDSNDIVEGVPLGSVRASLGWGSTEKDVSQFVQWIQDNYIF